MLPNMGNRLKDLRTAADMTQDQAAESMGVSKSQYIKLERGERRLTADYIDRAARAFGIRASDVLVEERTFVALMGFIGAGAEIEPEFEQTPPEGLDQIEVPFPLPEDMIAFEVRGDSMLPAYRDGTVIIVYREQQRPLHTFFGEEAAVRTSDGRRFIKTVTRGADGVTLLSWNASPIEDVHLEWIGEIFAVLPRRAINKVAKAGGIQGRLRMY